MRWVVMVNVIALIGAALVIWLLERENRRLRKELTDREEILEMCDLETQEAFRMLLSGDEEEIDKLYRW